MAGKTVASWIGNVHNSLEMNSQSAVYLGVEGSFRLGWLLGLKAEQKKSNSSTIPLLKTPENLFQQGLEEQMTRNSQHFLRIQKYSLHQGFQQGL